MSQEQPLKQKLEALLKSKKEQLQKMKSMTMGWSSPEEAQFHSGQEMELETSIEQLEELLK